MLGRNTIGQSLLIYDDIVVFGGHNVRSKPHAHHALEVILSKDLSTTVTHRGKCYISRGIILKADAIHETYTEGSALFIYFDPESSFARQFNHLFKGLQIILLSDDDSRRIIEFVEKAMLDSSFESTVKEFLSRTLLVDHTMHTFKRIVDDRVLKAISFIQQNLHRVVPMKELTEAVCLSDSRLFHLFKMEIGIPIRKYILWCRVRKALKLVIDGSSLTQAAQIAGFADVAHLNRTFVKFFGVSPSHVLKNTL